MRYGSDATAAGNENEREHRCWQGISVSQSVSQPSFLCSTAAVRRLKCNLLNRSQQRHRPTTPPKSRPAAFMALSICESNSPSAVAAAAATPPRPRPRPPRSIVRHPKSPPTAQWAPTSTPNLSADAAALQPFCPSALLPFCPEPTVEQGRCNNPEKLARSVSGPQRLQPESVSQSAARRRRRRGLGKSALEWAAAAMRRARAPRAQAGRREGIRGRERQRRRRRRRRP